MEQKQKGFFIVHKEDILVRLAPLNDAQFRLHFVNVAQADFKDGPDRKTGTINATFSQMLAGPLQTWSKSKLSRVRKALIDKIGSLVRIGKQKVMIAHYPLYRAKVKDAGLIFSLIKPKVLLTEQDVLQAKQQRAVEVNQGRANLAKKFTIPPSGVP